MTSGLHSCKPGNEPTVGETKHFTIEQRIGKSGKPWTKIKADREGQPYRVVKATKTDFTDDHGNISFNLEIEPSNGTQSSEDAPFSFKSAGPEPPPREDSRHYLMRAANLLKLCHNAAKAVIGDGYDGEDARTLFIAASREGHIKKMPDKPMSEQPEPDEAPEHSEEENF